MCQYIIKIEKVDRVDSRSMVHGGKGRVDSRTMVHGDEGRVGRVDSRSMIHGDEVPLHLNYFENTHTHNKGVGTQLNSTTE